MLTFFLDLNSDFLPFLKCFLVALRLSVEVHRVEVNCLHFVDDSPVVASWNVAVVTFAPFGDLDFAVSEFKEIHKTSSLSIS